VEEATVRKTPRLKSSPSRKKVTRSISRQQWDKEEVTLQRRATKPGKRNIWPRLH